MRRIRCKYEGIYSDYLTFGQEYDQLDERPCGDEIVITVASGYPVGFPRECFDLTGGALVFQSRSVWIAGETGWVETRDELDDNTDVIVTFEDRSRWIASLYTYANIATLAQYHEQTGEHLSGGYIWGSDMVLIDRLNRARIDEMISDLLRNGEFEHVFRAIGPEADDVA